MVAHDVVSVFEGLQMVAHDVVSVFEGLQMVAHDVAKVFEDEYSINYLKSYKKV